MENWLELSNAERRSLLHKCSLTTGIAPAALEKDWWQTLVLKGLFEMPSADYLTLKGSRAVPQA